MKSTHQTALAHSWPLPSIYSDVLSRCWNTSKHSTLTIRMHSLCQRHASATAAAPLLQPPPAAAVEAAWSCQAGQAAAACCAHSPAAAGLLVHPRPAAAPAPSVPGPASSATVAGAVYGDRSIQARGACRLCAYTHHHHRVLLQMQRWRRQQH